jgi:hypothetical protein
MTQAQRRNRFETIIVTDLDQAPAELIEAAEGSQTA